MIRKFCPYHLKVWIFGKTWGRAGTYTYHKHLSNLSNKASFCSQVWTCVSRPLQSPFLGSKMRMRWAGGEPSVMSDGNDITVTENKPLAVWQSGVLIIIIHNGGTRHRIYFVRHSSLLFWNLGLFSWTGTEYRQWWRTAGFTWKVICMRRNLKWKRSSRAQWKNRNGN